MKTAIFAVSSLAALAVLASPTIATAHVEISPTKSAAGKPMKFALEIGHGCDGAATNRLVVRIPSQAVEVKALPVKGWKVSTADSTMTWAGGPLADHDHLEFPFEATVVGTKGQAVLFKAIQKCEGGSETAWIETAQGGAEAEHPAPAVTLTSTAAPAEEQQADADRVAEEDAAARGEPTAAAGNADDSSDEGGSDGKSLLLIVVAGLAIGTVAGIIVRARRK